jgi:hypothetical protein
MPNTSPCQVEPGEGGWRPEGGLCDGPRSRRVTVDQGRVILGGIEVGELGELGNGGEGGELRRSRADAFTPNRHPEGSRPV